MYSLIQVSYFLFQQVVTIMSRTLHDLVLGELQQLTTKSQRDDRFDTYMKKTYNKTASLMANSCQAVAQMASTASNTGLALLKKSFWSLFFRPYYGKIQHQFSCGISCMLDLAKN